MTKSEKYQERLDIVAKENLDWTKFHNKTFLISGATGLIGKALIDILMNANKVNHVDCKIIALGRSKEKAKKRLKQHFDENNFTFLETDICQPIALNEKIDFIIHGASATHPLQYATDPIGTIMPNVFGLYNLLNAAVDKNIEKFIFLSSVEIYGENSDKNKTFKEDDLGYIDCNTLRAGYPESKRLGEAMLCAFKEKYGINYTALRLARVFGPTMLMDDSKAASQFIRCALNHENIVLKSDGSQEYSYIYGFDAARAILWLLSHGKNGEAYNVADKKCDITLRSFAEKCAELAGVKVVYNEPSDTEKAGFSKATRAILDATKLEETGFKIHGNFQEKLAETLEILNS